MQSRKRKVPFVPQMQQTECGLCCVMMVLRYHRSYETLNDLREYLDAGRDGLKLSQLFNLFKTLGFKTSAYKAPVSGFSQLPTPAILFWTGNHFVVLERMASDHAWIVDPAFGRKKITLQELEESYGGYILTAEPTEDFTRQEKRDNVWLPLLKTVFANKKTFTMITLLSLVTYLLTLSIPMLVQVLIDNVVVDNNMARLSPYFGAVLGVALVFGLLVFVRGKVLITLQMLLDRTIMSRTFSHLLKVPYKFFEVRSFGDLLFRLNSLHAIRDLLSEQLVKGVIDVGAVAFITAYMLSQSPELTLLAAALFLLNGFLVVYSRKFIVEANQYEINENVKLQQVQFEAMHSIFGIKTAGMEKVILGNWSGQLERVLERFKQRASIQNVYNTLTTISQTISPLVILSMGIYLYTQSSLTLGEVVAFHTLSGTFFALSASMFNTYNNFILTTAYLERIRDITDAEVEREPEHPVAIDLTGDIQLDNVSFSYTRHAEPVIRNVSMHIRPGEKVAFVGSSGSGKSTLSKIILGLYPPNEGTISYDGVNFDLLDKPTLRRQMGVVPQDINLFNKSIYENIRMNKDIEPEKVHRAAQVAQIADEIVSMPMGYETVVSEMGMNLSGGQRQRIALARAIVHDPKVIILDEATSSLDAINESKVSSYFKQAGCTRIVIAHRLSTIIDSDVIYVLDKGEIVEQGTHQELMELQGTYFRLYRTQSEDEAGLEVAVAMG